MEAFWLKQKNRNLIFIILFIIITGIVGNISYRGYISFRDTIVAQQQQHLLTISKSVAKSLELYVDEKMISLRILANTPSLKDYEAESEIEEELKMFFQQESVDNVLLFDEKGNILSIYPQTIANKDTIDLNYFKHDVNTVIESHKKYTSMVYKNKNNQFAINIVEPIMEGETIKGVLLCVVKLESMYERIVQPVKAGEQGYAMVKDSGGTILMHPAKEQVGYDVINSRRERYPDLDYHELEELIELQLQGQEGTAVYHSYWWPEEKLVKVKKLSAFTPAYVSDGEFWVIAVVMSYSEIQNPIMKYLIMIVLIAVLIVSLFSWTIYIFIKMKKNKEAYKLETEYLKQMNQSAEELRKKDTELQHSRRLRTIGTLTSGISHEFNNLLTPIMGHSEIILNHMDSNNEFYEGVHDIYDSTKKAKELIEQILVFSHSEKARSQDKSIPISKVIRDSIKFLSSILPSNVEVIDHVSDIEGYILGNETEIQQIMMNLYTNAYYAMKIIGGTLTIKTEEINANDDIELIQCDTQAKKYIKITVQDTGCGMDEDTLNQIFDPFFTSKPVGEGTGLGLSMVHGIVKKYGGKITVKSKLEQGSIFNIYLPITAEHKTTRIKKEEIDLRGHEKVLLVDDNAQITNVLKKGLMYLGYKVTAFTDSIEAIQEFNRNKSYYQIIVVDQSMPFLEGLNFADKVRQSRSDIKIILITAYREKIIDDSYSEKMIDDYLIKPFSANELSECIRNLIDKSK